MLDPYASALEAAVQTFGENPHVSLTAPVDLGRTWTTRKIWEL